MKRVFGPVLLLLLATQAFAARTDLPQVAMGHSHVCLLHDAASSPGQWGTLEVRCLGKDSFGETKVPPLSGPLSIAAGKQYSCAIHQGGILCWGENGEARTAYFRDFKQPKRLAAGFSALCAFDAQLGLRCLEERRNLHKSRLAQTVPALKQVKDLSVGYAQACALDGEGAPHCWGGLDNLAANPDKRFKEKHEAFHAAITTIPREVLGARTVAVGYSHVCAALSDRVQCWGSGSRPGSSIEGVLPLKGATALESGYYNSCASGAAGPECWGWNAPVLTAFLRALSLPLALAQSKAFFSPEGLGYCALDYKNLRCLWASATPQTAELPIDVAYANYDFVAQFEPTLKMASQYLYRSRVGFFARIEKILSTRPYSPATDPTERVFVVDAIEPVMESIRTRYFMSKIYPRYNQALQYYRARLGKHSLKDYGSTLGLRKVAAELIQAGLVTAKPFVTAEEDHRTLAELAPLLGTASVGELNAGQSSALKSQLIASRALTTRLQENQQMAGVGRMVEALTLYLISALP